MNNYDESSFRTRVRHKGEPPLQDYLLYVEGDSDKKFIDNIINQAIFTSVIAKDCKPLYRTPEKCEPPEPNRKQNVIQRIVNSRCNHIYGLIDKDLDTPDDIELNLNNSAALKKLFITDNHDLETLLIFKDEELLSRIFVDLCKKRGLYRNDELDSRFQENLKIVFYVAFQTGIVKKTLYDIKKTLHYNAELNRKKRGDYIPENKCIVYKRFIEDFYIAARELEKYRNIIFNFKIPSDLPINYMEFTKDLKININDFCKYVNRITNKPEPPDIVQDLLARNECYFTDGIFNKGMDDIVNTNGRPYNSIDFWNIVNGHDLLDVLCHVDQDIIGFEFNPYGKMKRPKDFEFRLVKCFCYEFFFNTSLYDSMHDVNLC